MEQRISLITLGVGDLRRAMDFYAGLGWQGSSPDDDVAFYQAGGMVFALWSRAKLAGDSATEDGGGWGGITLGHNVRSPEEVDAVLEQAAGRGRDRRARRRGDVLGRLLRRLPRPRRQRLGGRAQPVLDRARRRHRHASPPAQRGAAQRSAAGVRPPSATSSRVRCGWSA